MKAQTQFPLENEKEVKYVCFKNSTKLKVWQVYVIRLLKRTPRAHIAQTPSLLWYKLEFRHRRIIIDGRNINLLTYRLTRGISCVQLFKFKTNLFIKVSSTCMVHLSVIIS